VFVLSGVTLSTGKNPSTGVANAALDLGFILNNLDPTGVAPPVGILDQPATGTPHKPREPKSTDNGATSSQQLTDADELNARVTDLSVGQ